MTVIDDRTIDDRTACALVEEDHEHHRFRVHRSTMTSPDVFALEVERIFGRCWLYVGHESEIREPGDYVRRPVGSRQVFMVRSKAGDVKVFHNTCPHRGAMVCRKDTGNAKVFQCFYHAWSFDTEGKLVGVPDREAYGDGLDFGALGLRSVARVESYRGFVFACFDPGVVGLVEYLAGAAEYLDLIVDATGDAEIITGTNAYAIDANWKLLAENSVDGYHAVPTHDTYFKYLTALGTSLAGGVAGTATALGNGHAVLEYSAPWGRPVAKWEPLFGEDAREEISRIRADLVDRYGEDRARRMADTNRNLLIYPNLVVNDIMAITVRTFMPTSADRMEVTAWELAPRDELPQLRQRRLDSFLTFLGPGGFATPDDIEALESCQQGFRSGGIEWNDISRGMAREPVANDEEQMRAFWRRWNDDITGDPR
ncbi:MAG: p-cumate 2,3-dioxygenase subunit alpha [Pseudonocardiales bacterium]|jgi:p-cumate 2,3-dioxygenase alpha subunit|uniref:aromatic ring-hydroxylating oxygenase subunit alpha n=1 Tax=Pseudonocardia sp. TaxID=60912 RepID=UPI002604224C|nr:aromatic ring-hydroxylating dioxygenase subunit alpha [Pseudonocardia sp.]MCW2722998.1 p-cumate dioxygenase [Pseudonocardia sp.]MDT7618761.1 p-cumate 2,3-dioxygenase subunit alpha [Pseudonocardiales bacterium]MDT7706508.1 p-cumate 2,3-dioxygenase subunit alpha [Pseudonocardiales bacterium]